METFLESIKAAFLLQSNAKGRYPRIGYLFEGKGRQSSELRLLLLALDVRTFQQDPSLSLVEPITKQRL